MANTYGAENFGTVGNEDARTSNGMFASFWKSLVNSLSSVDKGATLANTKIAALFTNITKYGQSTRNLQPIRQYFLDISKNVDELSGKQIKLLLEQTGTFTSAMKKAFEAYGETGDKSKKFSAGLKDAGKILSKLSDEHLANFVNSMQKSTVVLADAISHISVLNVLNSKQDWNNVREGLEDTNQLAGLYEDTLRRIFKQYGVLTQEIDEGLIALGKTQTVSKELLAGLSQLSVKIHNAPNEEIKKSAEIIQTTRKTFKEMAKSAVNVATSTASAVMLVFKPLYEAALDVDKQINQILKSTDSLLDPEARKAFITSTSKIAARSGADLSEVMEQVADVASDLSLPISATAAGVKDSYGKMNPVLEKYISTARKMTKVADIGEGSLRKMYKAFRAGKSDVSDNEKVLKAFAGSLAFLRSMNGMTKEDVESYADSVSKAMTNMRLVYKFTDDQAINLERQMTNMVRGLNELGGSQTKFLAQDILKNLTGSTLEQENLMNLLGLHPSDMVSMLANQDLTPIRDALVKKFMDVQNDVIQARQMGNFLSLDEAIATRFGEALAGDAQKIEMIKQSLLNLQKDGGLGKFLTYDFNSKIPDIDKKYDELAKSLSNVVNRISGLGKKLLVNFGEPLARILAPVLRITANAFEWFINQLDRLPDSIKFILGLTAGLLTLGSVSGLLAKLMGGAGIFGKFFASIAAIGGFKVIAIITGITIALSLLNKALEKIFGENYIERFGDWFIESWESIVPGLKKSWDAAENYLETVFNTLLSGNFLDGLSALMKAPMEAVRYLFGGLLNALYDGFDEIFVNAGKNYVNWKNSTLESFGRLKKEFFDLFSFDTLSVIGLWIVDGIKNALIGAKNSVLGWLGFGNSGTPVPQSVGDNLKPQTPNNNASESTWGKVKSWMFPSQELVPQVSGSTIPSSNPLTTSFTPPQGATVPINAPDSGLAALSPLLPIGEVKTVNEKLLKEMIDNLQIIATNTKDSSRPATTNTWTPRPFTDAEYYTQSMADAARRNNTGG